MNKKNIIIIGVIFVISIVIAGLYGTFATSTMTEVSDNEYTITLNGSNEEIVIPADSSKTVLYQITNTNNGVVNYGLAYSGNNITVKLYYDSTEKASDTIDYGETKFVKLYIENSGTTDSAVLIKAILGYENGGTLDSILPSGYTLVKDIATPVAYAVYSADDYSLTFYKTLETIKTGSTYNGKTAAVVYTGFETETYSSVSSVPWYSYVTEIKSVIFYDEINPLSTAYWFYNFTNCTDMNLSNLDTSKVTSMYRMFYNAGLNATTFELIGLDTWDTSSVTSMNDMFYKTGYSATTFILTGLDNWDTSSVTDMSSMFYGAGFYATYALDLSNWNVGKVTSYSYFNTSVESKVKAPTWVN